MVWQRLWLALLASWLFCLFTTSTAAASVEITAPHQPVVTKSRNEKRLLIVAPKRFHAALRSYVRHKQRQLPTQLVSLERILQTSSGGDDPEKLKRYLYDEWRRRHAGYALLVGDADVLPVRYMVLDRVSSAAFDYAFYPSDLYYSDLARQDGSFDDWNARKDSFHRGYFGEVRGEKNKQDAINFDQIDYHPEIAVGRWPVNTLEGVRRVADKTIVYDEQVFHRTPSLRPRAVFLSVGGWVDSRDLMDNLAGQLSDHWAIEKRYYADASRNDGTLPPNEEQVDQLLNSGVSLLCHAGHGADDRWEGCFNLAHFDQVRNEAHLPVMISVGCSTARFANLPPYDAYIDINGIEHPGTGGGEVFSAPPPPPGPYQIGLYNHTGLGKELLCRGPSGTAAYIGCDTGSQPCGLTLLDGFVRAAAGHSGSRLGDCWSQAIDYYYQKERLAKLEPTSDWYPPSIFFQGMKFVVFGDPSLPLP